MTVCGDKKKKKKYIIKRKPTQNHIKKSDRHFFFSQTKVHTTQLSKKKFLATHLYSFLLKEKWWKYSSTFVFSIEKWQWQWQLRWQANACADVDLFLTKSMETASTELNPWDIAREMYTWTGRWLI
jgi:hypothetical protein